MHHGWLSSRYRSPIVNSVKYSPKTPVVHCRGFCRGFFNSLPLPRKALACYLDLAASFEVKSLLYLAAIELTRAYRL